MGTVQVLTTRRKPVSVDELTRLAARRIRLNILRNQRNELAKNVKEISAMLAEIQRELNRDTREMETRMRNNRQIEGL